MDFLLKSSRYQGYSQKQTHLICWNISLCPFDIGKCHFMGFKLLHVKNKGVFQIFHHFCCFYIKSKHISRVLTKTYSSNMLKSFIMFILTLECVILWVLSPFVWKIREFFKLFTIFVDFLIKASNYHGCSQKQNSFSTFKYFLRTILTLESYFIQVLKSTTVQIYFQSYSS